MKTLQNVPTAPISLSALPLKARAQTHPRSPARRSLIDRAFFFAMTALVVSGAVKLETKPE